MTHEEAVKYIDKAKNLKDILAHLEYIGELLEKHDRNCMHAIGDKVYFDFMYESGDKFVEDRILDILLHLHTKYENQLKDIQ